jgi:hypothetical protein
MRLMPQYALTVAIAAQILNPRDEGRHIVGHVAGTVIEVLLHVRVRTPALGSPHDALALMRVCQACRQGRDHVHDTVARKLHLSVALHSLPKQAASALPQRNRRAVVLSCDTGCGGGVATHAHTTCIPLGGCMAAAAVVREPLDTCMAADAACLPGVLLAAQDLRSFDGSLCSLSVPVRG